MKNLFILLATIISTSAMACPDLSGNYKCEQNPSQANDTGVITISQATEAEVTTYSILDADTNEVGTIVADDILHSGSDGSTLKVSCEAAAVKLVMTGVDESVGNYIYNTAFSLDASKNLVENGSIAYKYEGQDHNDPITSNCTRL